MGGGARHGVLALLAACAVLLAGCVAPPSGGAPQAGLVGPAAGAQEPLIRPIANPPRPGMTPTEVVSGFLDATAAIREDYRVARQYLSEDAAAQWNPGSGVTVMATAPPSLTAGADAVAVSFTQVGSVSASGVFTGQAPAAGSISFPMVSVDDQWKIAQAPPGLLLSSAQLERAFETRYVYFIDPTGTLAVPDLRVLPRIEPQALPTALVSSLLAGPSGWLDPAVRTELPGGLQLALGAVPVVDGTARVELSGPSISPDAAGAERLGAQLAWTLSQVPGARSVQVTVNGRPVALDDRTGPVDFSAYSGFDPDVLSGSVPLYGVDEAGGLVQVADGALRPVLPDPAVLPPAKAVAVGPHRDVYAAAAADGRSIAIGSLRAPEQPPQAIATTLSGRPSIDAANRVWWTDADGTVRVAVPDPEGGFAEAAVDVPGAEGVVRGVRPARDGTRIALLVASPEGMSLSVGAVVGDAEHGLAIENLRLLGEPGAVLDVVWHNAQTLAVIDPKHGVIRRIDLLGTQTLTFAIPAQAVTLTDAPTDPVVLGLADGTAGGLTGNGVRVVPGLRAPTYPG